MTTTVTPAASVANALRTVTRAACQIPAAGIEVTATGVRVVATNPLTAGRWVDRFPEGVDAGEVVLPLTVVVGAA